MSLLLLLICAAPAAGSIASALCARRMGDRARRVSPLAAGCALGGAVVLAFHVSLAGPVSAVIADRAAVVHGGLRADRLSVIMLVLVLAVSTVVQSFSIRYLSGDPRLSRLATAFGCTTTAVCALVCAATLSGLMAAWLLSGAGLLALLAQRADLPAARFGLRRAAGAFAVGDLALVAAGIILWRTTGDVDLRHLHAAAAALAHRQLLGLNAGAVTACLLVVAAMGRSALIPLQRWLPATLAAPTPVSAFLHAGLVNAGGFLLVRLAPLFGLTSVATGAAFAFGTATALYGGALMLAKPDVKGALAHSTMGQMGFMVMAVSLGVPAAAILHLVGHGMYKATLFLGADSVVHNDKRRASVPDVVPGGVRWMLGIKLLAAVLVPAVALGISVTTFAAPVIAHRGAIVLLTFAWASAATAAAGWLSSTPGRAAAGLAALAAVCVAYVGLITAATAFLAPASPSVLHPVSPWWGLLPVLAGLSCIAVSLASPRWHGRLYVRALDAGHVGSAGPAASNLRLVERLGALRPGSLAAGKGQVPA